MNTLQSKGLSILRWIAPGTYAFVWSRLAVKTARIAGSAAATGPAQPRDLPQSISPSRKLSVGPISEPSAGCPTGPTAAAKTHPRTTRPIPLTGAPKGLLYYACMFYTLALFFYNALECLTGGRLTTPESMDLIYLGILAAYAGDKEIGLWSSGDSVAESQKKKGEWFVFVWAAFAFVALALSGLFPARFAAPRQLTPITLQVIGIFFGTQVSRRLRQARQGQDILGKLEEAGLADRILALLLEFPGLTSGEIARRLGAGQRRVQRVLARMVREGLLVKDASRLRDPETSYRPA